MFIRITFTLLVFQIKSTFHGIEFFWKSQWPNVSALIT